MSGDKNTRALVGLVLVVVFAGALWLFLISPKRKEANELKTQVTSLQQSLATAQGQANEARVAKKAFPSDYRRMVLLGKAVPEGSETASLLVSLNRLADRTKTDFEGLILSSGGEASSTETAAIAGQAGPTAVAEPVPPTEAEAALLPLGATVGTANLGVMPYSLTFTGGFFQIANFIEEIESEIKTGKGELTIDGRLITIDGFSLVGLEQTGGKLSAEFTVTTYLVPPSGGTSSATTEATLPTEATSEEGGVQTSPPAAAAAATGTPSSYATGEAR